MNGVNHAAVQIAREARLVEMAKFEAKYGARPADDPARIGKLDEIRTRYAVTMAGIFDNAMEAERDAVLTRLKKLEIDGLRCTYELSKITDKYVMLLANEFLAPFRDDMTLMFSGADGRREVCPRSDLDYWFIFPEKWPAEQRDWPADLRQCMSDFYYAMDAMSFAKTTSMRFMSIEDYREEAHKEHETRTSLMEMRYIWGDSENFLALEEMTEQLNEKPLEYVRKHLATMKDYHSDPSYAAHRLEPDIKNSHGGLRDLQGVRWMAQALLGCKKDDDLVKHGFLSWDELAELEDAYNTLLTLRCHFQALLPKDAAGKKGVIDRLNPEHQAEIAKRFNVTPETLMQRYYRAARTIGFYTNITCAAIEEKVSADERMSKKHDLGHVIRSTLGLEASSELTPEPDGKGHVKLGDFIAFDRDAAPGAHEMLAIYSAAQEQNLSLHHTALRAIYHNTGVIDDAFRNDQAFRLQFLQILQGNNAESYLRQMQEIGLLQVLDPEMGKIDLLRQFDANHIFTVDEHTFRSMGHLQKIVRGEYAEQDVFAAALVREMSESDIRVLHYALYRHDVCKAGEKDGDITHPAEGARLIRQEGRSWGLNDEEVEKAAWLVENHLRLWHAAESMDLADPETARALSYHVPSPAHLRLLGVLTVADIMGEEQGKYNWYENSLIKGLYAQTEACLLGLPQDIRERRLDLPKEYAPGQTTVDLKREFNGQAVTMTVVTPEHAYLFENLILLLRSKRYNILQARADIQNNNGAGRVAINSVTFENGASQIQDKTLESLRDEVRRVARSYERLPIPKTAIGPNGTGSTLSAASNGVFHVRPEVEFAADCSEGFVFMKMTARDRPGLLGDISTIFNNHDLDVGFLRINTRGHKAVNSFKLRRRSDGQKLSGDQMSALYDSLMECAQ